MRREAPATARNRQPILDALRPHLPARGTVLEVASGSGEHTAYFAQALPALVFQPSDPDDVARASVDAWCGELGNVRPALALDAASATWSIAAADAVVCINMIHISPWESTVGLIRGAARLLPQHGKLFLYGPYFREGAEAASGNLAFDLELRAQNASWGVRTLEQIVAVARANGFALPLIAEMPANNLSLIFGRSEDIA